MDKKIGFIGCGNMGKAILGGLIASGQVQPGQIWVYTPSPDKVAALRDQYGINAASSAQEVAQIADIVFGAVKPGIMTKVLGDIASSLNKESLVVSIAAGASTPDRIIKEVYDKMTDEINTQETESFAELLEQTLKTLHTGEKVTGVITQINPTDIHVDLGVKQAGYIPTTELSDDPNYSIADNIHIGDEIEAYVMRVNDQEGTIMLSKKRLDAVKNWEVLEKAVESGEVFDCTITDVNKGGVIANVLGIRVFIPASQTGLPREADLSQLVKTQQKQLFFYYNQSV